MFEPEGKHSEVTMRLAVKADAPKLAELRYALRSTTGVATEPEAEFSKRCTVWMEEHLQNDNWQCWVAEIDQRMIAAVWGCAPGAGLSADQYHRYLVWNPRRSGFSKASSQQRARDHAAGRVTHESVHAARLSARY